MYSILQNDQYKMDELLQLTKDYGLNFLQNIAIQQRHQSLR